MVGLPLNFSLILAKLGKILLIAFLVLGQPVMAHAGILSMVAKIFESPVEAAETPTVNSQNMTLLQARGVTERETAKGGGDISIVAESALLPESGPLGTLADIEDGLPSNGEISIYVVHRGDSLAAIAKMFGVSSNTIIWANDIQGGIIREGQTLVILPISGVRYEVKKGDTLKSIASKLKADAREIASYNGISLDAKLATGDEIIVPDGEIQGLTSSSAVTKKTKRVLGANAPYYEGYYIHPLPGARKTQGLHGYNGIDLAAPMGEPIIASAAGTVIISRTVGWSGGYGKYLVIAHPNGTQTLYAHNSANAVAVGQNVARGQIIAYVGNTGKSTGPHVHFEVRGAKNSF